MIDFLHFELPLGKNSSSARFQSSHLFEFDKRAITRTENWCNTIRDVATRNALK